MNWKAAGIGLVVAGYTVTWVLGVPATRKSFKEELLKSRVATAATADSRSLPTLDEVAGQFDVRVKRIIPILPGVILVEHEDTVGSCGVGMWTVTLWHPGRESSPFLL